VNLLAVLTIGNLLKRPRRGLKKGRLNNDKERGSSANLRLVGSASGLVKSLETYILKGSTITSKVV